MTRNATDEFAIAMTTINSPRSEWLKYVRASGRNLFVAGDRTTSDSWDSLDTDHVTYLSIQEQENRWPELASLVPERNYARKNFAFLAALEDGHRAIWETDDDNYVLCCPLESIRDLPVARVSAPTWVNVYTRIYPGKHLWPRGFPLDEVRNSWSADWSVSNPEGSGSVDIWQFMVSGDPDVDAICRLVSPDYVIPLEPQAQPHAISLERYVYCPANTQNTLWMSESRLRWLYHPFSIDMRYSDIFKMYVAQSHSRLAFGPTTMYQNRNLHNYLDDFRGEISMYMDTGRLIECLASTSSHECTTLEDQYRLLFEAGLVSSREYQAAHCFETTLAALGVC